MKECEMSVKCNRTVCPNVGLHPHSNMRNKLYCSECVFLIEENVLLFGDPRNFLTITRDQARVARIDDELYNESD